MGFIDMNEQSQPPSTVKEIGIHLLYMSNEIREINTKLENFSTKEHVEQIETRVTDLEKRRIAKDTAIPIGLVVSFIINVLVLYQLFSGAK